MYKLEKLEDDLNSLKEVNKKYLNEINKLKKEKSKILSELNKKNKEIEELNVSLQRFKTKYFLLKKGIDFSNGVYTSHPILPKHRK